MKIKKSSAENCGGGGQGGMYPSHSASFPLPDTLEHKSSGMRRGKVNVSVVTWFLEAQ